MISKREIMTHNPDTKYDLSDIYPGEYQVIPFVDSEGEDGILKIICDSEKGVTYVKSGPRPEVYPQDDKFEDMVLLSELREGEEYSLTLKPLGAKEAVELRITSAA